MRLKASPLGEVPSAHTGRRGDGGRSTATFSVCPTHPSVTYGDSSPMRGAKEVNLNLEEYLKFSFRKNLSEMRIFYIEVFVFL